jgi:hypothetical protein
MAASKQHGSQSRNGWEGRGGLFKLEMFKGSAVTRILLAARRAKGSKGGWLPCNSPIAPHLPLLLPLHMDDHVGSMSERLQNASEGASWPPSRHRTLIYRHWVCIKFNHNDDSNTSAVTNPHYFLLSTCSSVNKLPTFYGAQTFITPLSTTWHSTLS